MGPRFGRCSRPYLRSDGKTRGARSPFGVTVAFLIAAATGCAADGDGEIGQPPPWTTTEACPALPPMAGFVTRADAALVVGNRPFRALGANLYYLQQLFSYAQQPGGDRFRMQAEAALDALVCLGIPVARTNAFNDGQDEGSAIRLGPDAFQEHALRGLDQAVAAAKARGIRLVLTLTNNWPEYGGLDAYARWAGKQHDDFFGDAQMLGYWKSHADQLVDRVNTATGVRYRDEPAILAWEIGNELRCRSCLGTDRYVQTVQGLAQHLKARAPFQLVSDGGEGYDDSPGLYRGLSDRRVVSGDEGASFSKLAALPELDLLSYHFYAGAWGLSSNDATVWIEQHERVARAAGKVAYLGEFGHDLPPDTDAERSRVYHRWLTRLFDAEAGTMGILWQLVPAVRTGMGERAVAVVFDDDRDSLGVLAFWARRASVE